MNGACQRVQQVSWLVGWLVGWLFYSKLCRPLVGMRARTLMVTSSPASIAVHTESAAESFFFQDEPQILPSTVSAVKSGPRSIPLPFFPCPLHRITASYVSPRQVTICLHAGLVCSVLTTSFEQVRYLYDTSPSYICFIHLKLHSSPSSSSSVLQLRTPLALILLLLHHYSAV